MSPLRRAIQRGGVAVNPLLENPATDATAPLRFSIGVTAALRSTIRIVVDDFLQVTPPALSVLTLGGVVATAKTLLSITITDNNIDALYDSEFVGSDAPTLSYVVPGANPIRNTTNLNLAAFAAVAVANQIPNPVAMVAHSPLNYDSLGGGAWTRKVTADFARAQLATSSDHPANFGDMLDTGWVECDANDTGAVKRGMMLSEGGNADHPSVARYQVYVEGNVASAATNAGAVGSTHTFTGGVVNRRIRLYRSLQEDGITTGTVFAQYSADAGRNWATFHTFASLATESLAAFFIIYSTTEGVVPRVFGMSDRRY